MNDKETAFTIRMPDSLRREIRKRAGAADMSMNAWIINILQKETQKEEKNESNNQ